LFKYVFHSESDKVFVANFSKITIVKKNQGALDTAGGLNPEQGTEPPLPPHFNQYSGGAEKARQENDGQQHKMNAV